MTAFTTDRPPWKAQVHQLAISNLSMSGLLGPAPAECKYVTSTRRCSDNYFAVAKLCDEVMDRVS
jgi:hypothetical protein